MLEYFKSREALVNVGERYQLYRNLHKGEFSLRESKSRLVVAHGSNITLTKCKLVINKLGQEKVIREQRKNVHAWIEGTLEDTHREMDMETDTYKLRLITYNPYRDAWFVYADTGERVDEVDRLYAHGDRVYEVVLK